MEKKKIEDVLVRLQEADRVCKNMLILMDYHNFWKVDALFHDKKKLAKLCGNMDG